MKDLVIVGTGGHSKDVEWLIERINAVEPTWNLLGFIDRNTEGKRVIGDDDFICRADKPLSVVIAIGSPVIRKALVEKYRSNSNIDFPNLIDPSVIVSRERTKFGVGNTVFAGTLFGLDVTVGDFCIVNFDCVITHDGVVGDYVTLNPSVNLSGNVLIGSQANIGTGTQILQGRKVGRKTIVGAGAVVNRDLPENCTAVGVPAKVIKINEDT